MATAGDSAGKLCQVSKPLTDSVIKTKFLNKITENDCEIGNERNGIGVHYRILSFLRSWLTTE